MSWGICSRLLQFYDALVVSLTCTFCFYVNSKREVILSQQMFFVFVVPAQTFLLMILFVIRFLF